MIQAAPTIARDKRLLACRELLRRKGHASKAVTAAEIVVSETRVRFGANDIESAPAYFEYGRALMVLQQEKLDPDYTDKVDAAAARKAKANASANAAERRAHLAKTAEPVDLTADEEDQGLSLAVETMEEALSVVEEAEDKAPQYRHWIKSELPRMYKEIGIGMSRLGRHTQAIDRLFMAKYFLDEAMKDFPTAEGDDDIEHFTTRCSLVEVCLLIAHEILACPPYQDIYISEQTQIPAAKRVSVADSLYELAQRGWQAMMHVIQNAEAKASRMERQNARLRLLTVSTLYDEVGRELDDAIKKGEASGHCEPPAKKHKAC